MKYVMVFANDGRSCRIKPTGKISLKDTDFIYEYMVVHKNPVEILLQAKELKAEVIAKIFNDIHSKYHQDKRYRNYRLSLSKFLLELTLKKRSEIINNFSPESKESLIR